MDRATYPRVAAASLIVLGFILLEVLNYPDARSDFEPMNVSADLAVLFVAIPAILLLALFLKHEVACAVTAMLIGVAFFSLISPQEPFRVAPVMVGSGGILAICAYALRVGGETPPPVRQTQS